MAKFLLSLQAESDLDHICTYTLRIWGSAQAIRYLDDLEATCQRLAALPTTGRLCEYIRPDLRRMEQGHHVIFYRSYEQGIKVCRIMHERMLPEYHDMEDEQ